MPEIMVIEKKKFSLGESGIVKMTVGRLPSDTEISIEAHVFRSKVDGPTLLIMAGVHGDEINGVEIVRKLLHKQDLNSLNKGTIIIIPLLNVFGFINFNRLRS